MHRHNPGTLLQSLKLHEYFVIFLNNVLFNLMTWNIDVLKNCSINVLFILLFF